MTSLNDLSAVLAIPKLEEDITRVEKNLEAVIQNAAKPIHKPALRVLRGSGKRLRPTLVIAAGLCQNGKITDDLIAAATAIELLHLGSLVHDDIMDHAASRWNQPTIFSQEGQNTAILVGDYFLAQAVAEGAKISGHLALILAQTITTMCEGQSLESANLYNLGRTVENYYQAIRQKTAIVLASACRIGGMCSNLPPEQLEALANYGESFGMAFQLTDDLLDLTASDRQLGKPAGNDITEGNYTLPVIKTAQGPLSSRLQRLITTAPHKQEAIISLLKESGSLEATVTKIESYNQQASATLNELTPSKIVEGLAKLPDYYWQWAQQKSTLPL